MTRALTRSRGAARSDAARWRLVESSALSLTAPPELPQTMPADTAMMTSSDGHTSRIEVASVGVHHGGSGGSRHSAPEKPPPVPARPLPSASGSAPLAPLRVPSTPSRCSEEHTDGKRGRNQGHAPGEALDEDGSSVAQRAAPRVCFDEACTHEVLRVLRHARESVRLAAYTFDHRDIWAMVAACSKRGVDVRILMNAKEARERHVRAREGWLVPPPLSDRLRVRAAGGKLLRETYTDWDGGAEERGIFHNKFVVCDERLVVTGSFNFTYAAATVSAENTITIDDDMVAAQYASKFDACWAGAVAIKEEKETDVSPDVHETKAAPAKVLFRTATGKCYHTRRDCSGLRRARALMETDANGVVAAGLQACKLCANR